MRQQEEIPVSQESSLKGEARVEQVTAIVPSLTPPPQTAPQHSKEGCLPWRIHEAPPTYNKTGALRQRNMAQMKEQIKTPEKELRDEEINNPSDAEFKTLVIRMLTELIELSCKMKEEMKATQHEIKQNI